MSSIPLSDIVAIVVAARVQGPPALRASCDGRRVRVLTLRGPRPGELYDFTLGDGHRRWCLESVSHDSGVDVHDRTLGRRLSARLDVLHGIAAEHFAERRPVVAP
ncbi:MULTISPECIES: hypothetical protein [unclassified Streptomyces]|uniref:hypothetical protein n=1 Tax=unclassified Streptomyces TaxID=2593676 RepID=UPI0036BF71C3